VSSAKQYQEAGASTYTVEAPGKVKGKECVALSELPKVQAAGAIRAATALAPAAFPSSTIPYFETTPGFSAVLNGLFVFKSGTPHVVIVVM